MHDIRPAKVAIVDYGLGNLYSVQRACEHVGLQATITADRQALLRADAVLLPGVGAYGNAMETLHKLDLVRVLQDIAASDTLLVGICLGVQLLMTESYEFGRYDGLGIIAGSVVRFECPLEVSRPLKIPQVGWNRIQTTRPWRGTLLDEVRDGEYMYFVHSYIVQPEDPGVILSTSRYGHIEFCSSLGARNIFACQFHPERSGVQGLKIYRNLAQHIRRAIQEGLA